MSEIRDLADMRHPMQPLGRAGDGVTRFKANAIVRHLLDHGGIDMNALARLGFTREDREQFAQLIGYSLSGFGSLGFVSDECYATAEQMLVGDDERDARIAALEAIIADARAGVKEAAVALFRIHPDDLGDPHD